MKILNLLTEHNHNNHRITKPYIIAEIGVNHGCSMDTAKMLIDEAKEGGADAVKFQAYKANTIASKNSPAYWDTTKESTQSQYKLFKKYDKFWKKEFEDLKKYCDTLDIEFMSTPFDIESAYFLNDLMDVYKISSSDITNKPFIETIANFGKPIILSTGASYLWEIEEALSWIDSYKVQVVLMHCVLNYPTKDKNANLGMILDLECKFPDRIIGYSDHTLPGKMKVLETAMLLGARVLEKHFTYDKTLPGNDHYHAMDKNDLKVFTTNITSTIELLGQFKKSAIISEEPARQHARRSLVVNRLIRKGEKISEKDLTFKRPAHGISPKLLDEVKGKIVRYDLEQDSILQWCDLK